MWRVALLLAACTQPQYVSGHLHCSATGRACPDDFYCGAGGLCWQNGSGPELGAADDLGLADLAAAVDLAGVDLAGADLSALPDLAVRADLAGVDLAGGDASVASLCPGTFKICDGFETATLDARWTSDLHGGTITVDTSRAYRGASSLHLHTDAAATAGFTPFANLVTYSTLPYTTTAYARAWFFFPSNYSSEFNQVLNFSESTGQGVAFATAGGHPILNDYSTPNSYMQSATVTLPTNQWVCLSLSLSQTGTSGTVKQLVNDVEVSDTTFASAATPAMDHIYLGLDWVGNPASFPATDLWMDEVVINDSPVGCAQ
jgi:hypothetical protein